MSTTGYTPASAEELAREAAFWDSAATIPEGWVDAPEAIPRIGESTAISLRVPTKMLAILREFARREGIGYQVLMKRWLDDRIREERNRLAARLGVQAAQETSKGRTRQAGPPPKMVADGAGVIYDTTR